MESPNKVGVHHREEDECQDEWKTLIGRYGGKQITKVWMHLGRFHSRLKNIENFHWRLVGGSPMVQFSIRFKKELNLKHVLPHNTFFKAFKNSYCKLTLKLPVRKVYIAIVEGFGNPLKICHSFFLPESNGCFIKVIW